MGRRELKDSKQEQKRLAVEGLKRSMSKVTGSPCPVVEQQGLYNEKQACISFFGPRMWHKGLLAATGRRRRRRRRRRKDGLM